MSPQETGTNKAGHNGQAGGVHGRANRLVHESSPYLLQHAYNPVDWWPWGPGAFEEARRREVPILLSVGYSTCYWCHVMERECFESEAIARLMNERFVCVKLDREERPDVDDAYMNALLAMTSQGGWPMNCFLDPATLKPFWCGTYFPPEPAMGRPSWPQVLGGVGDAWRDRRDEVVAQSEALAGAVAERMSDPVVAPVGARQVADAIGILLRMFDPVNGGFGRAPKFPQPVFLDLLLEVRAATDEATQAAIDSALRRTLDKMACGGLFDQVGGGFHRYSVDEFWLVPHFEKMLYDNAQLAAVYLRASEVYGDAWYGSIARRTLDYILREMVAGSGGFSSAQDAEVDAREGLNYLWTAREFDELLGEEAAFAKRVYGLDAGPNFRDPHHPEEAPRSVLRLDDRPDQVAAKLGMTPEEFGPRLDRVNARLLEARARRPRPQLDDKVITAWNGLMIAAMARGSRVLRDRRYLDAALAAAGFVLTNMRNEEGELFRVSRAGRTTTPAVLEDYTFLAGGLMELHGLGAAATTLAHTPAQWADELMRTAKRLFKDARSGAYMDADTSRADLFVRMRSTHDGALPSGNSTLLNALIDLVELDGSSGHREEALAVLASLSGAIRESPVGAANAVRGLFRLLRSSADEVRAVVGEAAADEPEPAAGATAAFTPVEVYADRERLTVGHDGPGELRLVIRIAPGHHILAADPGPGGAGLTPLRIGVTGGQGLAVYADYPAGEVYGAVGELLVHKDEIEFSAAVELQGEWRGRPVLTVTYQACTETHCLAPTTVELDVAIDRT